MSPFPIHRDGSTPASSQRTAGSQGVFHVVLLDGDDSIARLAFVGELDLATAPMAATALAEATGNGNVPVEIDASELAFCDSSGLHVLIETNLKCSANGGWLRVINARPEIVRLLEITGLEALADPPSAFDR